MNQIITSYFHEGYCSECVSSVLKHVERLSCPDLRDMAQVKLPKFAIFCRLYHIDKNAGDICMYNQFITDQSNIGELLKLTNPEMFVSHESAGNYFSAFF